MNWQKYTLDEWLAQFGAWCNTCMMKGGNLPDGLHINNIYWLMQSVNPDKQRHTIICEISDDEAYAINDLLCQAMAILPKQIELVIRNKLHHDNVRSLADQYGLSYKQVAIHINNAIYYLSGIVGIRP